MILKKMVSNRCPTASAYDSAESIATPPDSERHSPVIHPSRNPEVSGKPDAECVQKGTQAYHSRRESL